MTSLSGTVAIFMTPNRGRFVIMKVVQHVGSTEFQTITGFNVSDYTVKAIDLETNGDLMGTFPVKTFDGAVIRKQIRKYDTCLVVNTAKNERLDVIRFSDPTRIIGAAFYANAYVESQLPKPVFNYSPPAPPSVPPSVPPSLPSPAYDISGNTVQHVAPPTFKKPKPLQKPIQHASLLPSFVPNPAKSGLNLFVAKQLLELAQLKKEMCPIIAEEFSAGHTAAMPCGHMFSQTAIEESFKKEPSKCPACRQYGRPTYV